MSFTIVPIAPVCQYFHKVDILVWLLIDARKRRATNCSYETDVWEIRVKAGAKE